MLYGQQVIEKIAYEDFFENNQNAILGGIKGVGMGTLFGALKSVDDGDKKWKQRIKNIGGLALVGGASGVGIGHLLDSHKDDLRDFARRIQERVDKQTDK